jgi:Na+-driven multidrug efflux pump
MIVHVLTGLWLTPFTLRRLDRQEFAIFSLTLDVVGWLTLLDLGITAGLRIQAARLSGLPQQDKVNRLASTAFYAQNVIVLFVLIFGAGLALAFPHFFAIRPELQRDAMWVMALTVLGAGVSMGSQTFSALLVANQQMHIDNIIGLLLIAIRTIFTVVLLELGFGIYSLAIAHLAARVTTAIFAVFRTYRLLSGLQLKWHLASWDVFKQIGGLGVWFTIGCLAGIVIQSMSSAVTAKIISVETVTALVLTGRFYELSSGLVFLISENARPMLGQMLGQNETAHGLRTYRQLFGLSSGLAIVAGLGVWAGNGTFVTRWVGPVNYGGQWVDLALAGTIIVGLWNLPNRVVLSANLAVRGQALVRMFEGALNLCLAVWFGRKLGLAGIPLAAVVACALSSMWMLPLLTARMFKRSFRRFLWDDAARAVAVFLLLFPVAWVSRAIANEISGYFGAAIGGILTCAFGLTLVWFIVLDKAVRERIPLRKWYDKACAGMIRLLPTGFSRS